MAAKKQIRTKPAKKGSVLRADEISRALNLVRQGMTVRDVGRIMGISHGKAQNLIAEGRNSIPVDAARELLAEVIDRERAIVKAHWRKREDPEHARVIQASDKVILATLPVRAEISGPDGAPILLDVEHDHGDAILGKLASIAADLAKSGGDPGAQSGGA